MTYLSRHTVRDMELPKHRERLLQAAVEDLDQDPNVIGIFLGGSLAREDEDSFSDIDLRVVVQDEEFDHYIRQKKERSAQWGNVLYYEDLYELAPYTIAHYDCFLKIDVFYYKSEHVVPSLWLKQMKIVKDSGDFLQQVFDASQHFTYEPSKQEVEGWRGKILAYMQDAYIRVMRGELTYALLDMNAMRWFVTNGWNMEANRQSNDSWNWSRIEGRASSLEPWQLALLDSWHSARDPQEIMKTIASMLPEIVRLNRVLSRKVGIQEDRELLEQVIASVF